MLDNKNSKDSDNNENSDNKTRFKPNNLRRINSENSLKNVINNSTDLNRKRLTQVEDKNYLNEKELRHLRFSDKNRDSIIIKKDSSFNNDYNNDTSSNSNPNTIIQHLAYSTDFSPPLAASVGGVKETNTMSVDFDPITGFKMVNQYLFIRELGRGCHGKVKLCLDVETNELYAVKIVSKINKKRTLLNKHNAINKENNNNKNNKSELFISNKIQREIAILKKCNHPNVVRLREVIDANSSAKIYLILEYMDGGGLEFRDEKTDKPIHVLSKIRTIMRDVVLGLEYLHHQGIIHRDIKPANLLISQSHAIVKISDFGVSYTCQVLLDDKIKPEHSNNIINNTNKGYYPTVDEFELAKTVGTPAFFAPELCWSETNSSSCKRPRITKAIDIWSLGVTLYCFVYGKCPFVASNEYELFEMIPKKKIEYCKTNSNQEKIPSELISLMHGLMEKSVSQRMDFRQIKVLYHIKFDKTD